MKIYRSSDFCGDQIDAMTNFAIVTSVVINGAHCTCFTYVMSYSFGVYLPITLCPRSLNNWISLVILHVRPTNTSVSVIPGVNSRLNEICYTV